VAAADHAHGDRAGAAAISHGAPAGTGLAAEYPPNDRVSQRVWSIFQWRNPIAMNMSFWRDFGAVVTLQKLDK